jgi:cytochrome c-type biogenesis protein CcmH/NrfG
MENSTVDSTASATAESVTAPPQKQTLLQRTPKWALLSVPVIAVALLGYGYSTGYLQEATSKVTAAVAAFSPAVAKAAGVEDQLSVARSAFAAGNMNAAIAGYRAHIAANPTDLSAHGELGNVLYTVGALPEAAQAYFDTATMALEQNHPEIAEALLPAVSEGNPLLADQLSDKLYAVYDAQMRADLSRPVEGGQPQQAGQQTGQQAGVQHAG